MPPPRIAPEWFLSPDHLPLIVARDGGCAGMRQNLHARGGAVVNEAMVAAIYAQPDDTRPPVEQRPAA